MELRIDIETRSGADIGKTGLYRYAQDEEFKVLLFAYKMGKDDVKIVDLENGELIPRHVLKALVDPNVKKRAFNAAFEWYCLNRAGIRTPLAQWECTMIHGMYCGYPASLDAMGKAIGLPQDKRKMAAGKALIRYFCVPCKPTKANGGRRWNLPRHAPEKWELFKDYCKQDVATEAEIDDRLSPFPVPDSEWAQWRMDVEMNATGVRVDSELIQGALAVDAESTEALMTEASTLTGQENPNSVSQLKQWFYDSYRIEAESLDKEALQTVEDELRARVEDGTVAPEDAAPGLRVLGIRRQLGKTSVKKYAAMAAAKCKDDRVRGLTQFYGANRTGRWCLTGDHEVLTASGWVRLEDWTGGIIACWAPYGELVSFQNAEAVQFDYDGVLYHYEDARIDQISTPEHKMYVKKKYGGQWQPDTVENMRAYRPSVPFTGWRKTSPGMEHAQLRVLVMVQADGHFTRDGDLRLHFKKERKIERCKQLLRKAEIPFALHTESSGAVNIRVPARSMPLWLRIFRGKTFESWLFDESADVFFDELANWDGYWCGPNSIQYVTCNKSNADIVQAFAHMSGRSAVLKIKYRSNQNWSTSYILNIWMNPGNCHEIRKKPSVVQYTGKVYCAVTNPGYFLVRRNGKVWVTGNSGRLVQLQNLPRNYISTLDSARRLVKKGNLAGLRLLYENVPDVLSQLIRTAFIPSEGGRLVVADFSAIEARVIAWLAGEQWVNEVFATHGKIYEATASQMFHVPIEKIKKGNPEYSLRQKGKVATLALGYQGGVNALKAMGAMNMGLSEDELPDIVTRWRQANARIVDLWHKVGQAALAAVKTARPQGVNGLVFALEGEVLYGQSFLTIRLPSGRKLYYPKPFLAENRYGYEAVHYYSVNQQMGKWEINSTYGGKMTENVVQAVARDCLAETLKRLHAAGLVVVFHVHDEVIIDADADLTADDVCKIMAEPISWAPGLILKGAGFEGEYYRKD